MAAARAELARLDERHAADLAVLRQAERERDTLRASLTALKEHPLMRCLRHVDGSCRERGTTHCGTCQIRHGIDHAFRAVREG